MKKLAMALTNFINRVAKTARMIFRRTVERTKSDHVSSEQVSPLLGVITVVFHNLLFLLGTICSRGYQPVERAVHW